MAGKIYSIWREPYWQDLQDRYLKELAYSFNVPYGFKFYHHVIGKYTYCKDRGKVSRLINDYENEVRNYAEKHDKPIHNLTWLRDVAKMYFKYYG